MAASSLKWLFDSFMEEINIPTSQKRYFTIIVEEIQNVHWY